MIFLLIELMQSTKSVSDRLFIRTSNVQHRIVNAWLIVKRKTDT